MKVSRSDGSMPYNHTQRKEGADQSFHDPKGSELSPNMGSSSEPKVVAKSLERSTLPPALRDTVKTVHNAPHRIKRKMITACVIARACSQGRV